MTVRMCIASSKGGVGKTTLALNLAVGLAERGHRTLLVDLDPEGGIGLSLAKPDAELAGLADVIAGVVPPSEAVLRTKLPTLSILPRGRLDPRDTCEFEDALQRPGALGSLISSASADMDIVLFDTPSGLGRVPRAALAISDFLLVPLQAEPLAMRALPQLLRVVDQIREAENPKLRLLGIAPTMVDIRKEASRGVLEELWSDFTGVLDSVLPRSDVFAKASQKGLPAAFLGGPMLPEMRRVEMLAAEVDSLMEDMKKEEERAHERPERNLI